MMEIIDFDRLNELSTLDMDGTYSGKCDLSRGILKGYMKTYRESIINNMSRHKSNEKEEYYELILETLRYNKILVNTRTQKLDDILSQNE